jgi:23S rRNA pseudouridine2605 synthase
MRINKYVALATGMSRRAADAAISEGRVLVNGDVPETGYLVQPDDTITLDGCPVSAPDALITIMLHKPAGYVSSRTGQGSKTIYDLLPANLHHLKPVGRLDKNSSGLLLLTNDGELANRLTHPRYQKEKIYEIEIDRPLTDKDFGKITQHGVDIGDNRPSKLHLAVSGKQQAVSKGSNSCTDRLPHDACYWRATLAEGRNRQIRRTFAALGYEVTKLHRLRLGTYSLGNLPPAHWKEV